MSIADKITRLQTAKTSIATAITNKGGTVSTGDGFEDFSTDIGTIPTGFSGSIKVTGTSQSDTVSASKGGITKQGVWTDNSYHLISNIDEVGTWAVSASNGVKTKTYNVLIDSAEQVTVEVDYIRTYLYNLGDECNALTGGWTSNGYTSSLTIDGAYTKNANNMYSTTGTRNHLRVMGTVLSIDFTDFTYLKCDLVKMSGVRETISYNVQNLTGNKYICFQIFYYDNGNDYNRGYILSTKAIEGADIFLNEGLSHSETRNITIYKVWFE